MRNCTRFSLNAGFGLVLLFVATLLSPLHAQSHRLTITAPANIAGTYDVQIAAFGASYCNVKSLTGTAVLVRDRANATTVCDSVTADLTGKIAIIDRGTCTFSAKADRAQKKGAKAVLLFNNQGGTAIPVVPGDGVTDARVTVPVFMVGQTDGAKIKAAVGAGVAITIDRIDVIDDTPANQIVWGKTLGQGDFNGGLNGWKVRSLSCARGSVPANLWLWNATGTARGGCGGTTITSPTQCNGAMVFESDYLDTKGAGCGGAAQGTGTCPAPQTGELISPVIKPARKAAGYSVKFYQEVRHFAGSSYYIGWSKNGGRTWDSVAVNTDIAVNSSNNDNYTVVPLIGSGSADSLVLKFRYTGNYYYWLVDDVLLLEQESNNLKVNSFFAVPPNAATPLSQVEPIGFLADIANVGAKAQTKVKLKMTISNASSNAVVYKDSLAYNTVAGNTVVENVPFAKEYTPTARGGYVGIYSISADSADYNPADNADGFVYVITDTTFAKEFGATRLTNPAASNWTAGDPHAAAYGNGYFVPKGKGTYMRSVSFGIGNASALKDQPLLITLYEWKDANNDGDIQPAERVSVATRIYIVSGTETAAQIITTRFPEPGDPFVELKDNTYYVLMVEYIPAGSQTLDLQYPQSDEVDYSGTAFYGELKSKRRYASFTGLGGDLTKEDYGSVGFGRNFSYVVRMNVGAKPTGTNDLPLISNEFTVYPNPTSETLNLQLLLKDVSKEAVVRIMDMSGRIMSERYLGSVQRESVQFSVESFTSGTYIMQVTTDKGVGFKRFVVAK
jgi:hypothetical protein